MNLSELFPPIPLAVQNALNDKANSTALTTKADLVSGKVPHDQLPLEAYGQRFPAASQVEMLALAAQQGDTCIRSDDASHIWQLTGGDASVLANWSRLQTAADAPMIHTTPNRLTEENVTAWKNGDTIIEPKRGNPLSVTCVFPPSVTLAPSVYSQEIAGHWVIQLSNVPANAPDATVVVDVAGSAGSFRVVVDSAQTGFVETDSGTHACAVPPGITASDIAAGILWLSGHGFGSNNPGEIETGCAANAEGFTVTVSGEYAVVTTDQPPTPSALISAADTFSLFISLNAEGDSQVLDLIFNGDSNPSLSTADIQAAVIAQMQGGALPDCEYVPREPVGLLIRTKEGVDASLFSHIAEDSAGGAYSWGYYVAPSPLKAFVLGDITKHNLEEGYLEVDRPETIITAATLSGAGDIITHNTAEFATAAQGVKAAAALPASGGNVTGTLNFSGVTVGPLADSVGGGTAKLAIAANTGVASPLKLYSNVAGLAYNAQTNVTGSTAITPHQSLLAIYANAWDGVVRGLCANMAATFNYSSTSLQNTYLVGYHSVATNRGSGVVAGVVGYDTHIGNQTTTVGQSMPFAKQYVASSPICYPDAPIAVSTGLEIEPQKTANVGIGYGINQLGESDINIFKGLVRLPNATLNLTDRTTVPSVSNVQDLFLRRRMVDATGANSAEFTYTKTGSGNTPGGWYVTSGTTAGSTAIAAWYSSSLIKAPGTNSSGAITLNNPIGLGFSACAQDGTQSANGVARVTFGKSITTFGAPVNTCLGWEFRFTGSGKNADVYFFSYNGSLTYSSVLGTVNFAAYHDFLIKGNGMASGQVYCSIDGGAPVLIVGISNSSISNYFTLEITNGADSVDNRLLITPPVVAF